MASSNVGNGKAIFDAAINNKLDELSKLLKNATASDINWQDAVRIIDFIYR